MSNSESSDSERVSLPPDTSDDEERENRRPVTKSDRNGTKQLKFDTSSEEEMPSEKSSHKANNADIKKDNEEEGLRFSVTPSPERKRSLSPSIKHAKESRIRSGSNSPKMWRKKQAAPHSSSSSDSSRSPVRRDRKEKSRRSRSSSVPHKERSKDRARGRVARSRSHSSESSVSPRRRSPIKRYRKSRSPVKRSPVRRRSTSSNRPSPPRRNVAHDVRRERTRSPERPLPLRRNVEPVERVRHKRISPPRRDHSRDRNLRDLRRSPPRRDRSGSGSPQRKRSPPRRQERTPPRRHERSPPRRDRSGSRSPQRKRTPPRRQERRRYDSDEDRDNERQREDRRWIGRRNDRMDILERGDDAVWAGSPSHKDIQEVYALIEEAEESNKAEAEARDELKEERRKEKKTEERKRKADLMKDGGVSASDSTSDSEDERSKKKKKKSKKVKKEKKAKKDKKEKRKKHKKRTSKKSDDEESVDEWVEVTDRMRIKEAEREAKEAEDMPGPAIPDHLLVKTSDYGVNIKASYGKDMLRGEAEALAAYAARGERIPRRGEIGLSSSQITDFERAGYIMSGTRHKAMEATRLRKENQILTAEEKRMLSGFSHEERKKKEDTILSQFKSIVKSKQSEA